MMHSLEVVHFDEFDNPQSGWGDAAVSIPDKPRWYGYKNGRFFVERPRPGVAWVGGSNFSAGNCVCTVTGRVSGAEGASWGLLLQSPDHRFATRVSVTNDQKVTIRPMPQIPMTEGVGAGPFVQPQLKEGDQFNTIALALRDSRLEVYANGQRVCDPIALPDIDTVQIQAVVAVEGASAVAELERIAIVSLPPDKTRSSTIARDLSRVEALTPGVAPLVPN